MIPHMSNIICQLNAQTELPTYKKKVVSSATSLSFLILRFYNSVLNFAVRVAIRFLRKTILLNVKNVRQILSKMKEFA